MNFRVNLLIASVAFSIVTMAAIAQQKDDYNTLLAINRYDWNVKLDFDNKLMEAICKVEIVNNSNRSVKKVPFVLYRLLTVREIKSEGTSLSFTQNIKSFEDHARLQSNFITVELNKPLRPNQSITLELKYDGTLYGYTEVGWNYVRDKIDPNFTILRPDCMAYPELGYPSHKINKQFSKASFDYRVSVTIPDSLVAVNGGSLVTTNSTNGHTTFEFENTEKAWRMDIAISNYRKLTDNGLLVYYFKQDSLGAKKVLEALRKTTNLYSNWWGPLNNFKGFSIIEIPDGYGSQADVTSILQAASAFKDSTEMHQAYHEISHLWNVNLKAPSPRWEEGLATFIEYLTIEKLEHREYLEYVTNWVLQVVRREVTNDTRLKTMPMVDFGKHGMTDYSYSLGMIAFRILYEILGEKDFNQSLKIFYQDYSMKEATTEDFVRITKLTSGRDLTTFFNDWFFTTRYVTHIEKEKTFEQLVMIYK
ncbi:MAG: hypothetical protein L6Q51_06075 [Cyclobacteriaceae bacterium]|nr:hypothetical protein [Cyclobacteriaceae bacterium]